MCSTSCKVSVSRVTRLASTPAAKDSIRKAREYGATSTKGRVLVWLRRVSQASFLFLFLFLLVKTEYIPQFDNAATAANTQLSLDQPVNIFLSIDPLVGLSTAVAAHSLFKGLIWCLVLAIPTILIGRFFCGWICPFGTLHHWVSGIFPNIKGGKRIKRNRLQPYMRLKFYILVGFLVASLFTTVQIGLLDPICLMVRSVGLAIIPALNYAVTEGLNLLALTRPPSPSLLPASIVFFFLLFFCSLHTPVEQVPTDYYELPLGKADIVTPGTVVKDTDTVGNSTPVPLVPRTLRRATRACRSAVLSGKSGKPAQCL